MTLTDAQRKAMFARNRNLNWRIPIAKDKRKEYILTRKDAIYLTDKEKNQGFKGLKREIHQENVQLARRTFGQNPTASQVRAVTEQERRLFREGVQRERQESIRRRQMRDFPFAVRQV